MWNRIWEKEKIKDFKKVSGNPAMQAKYDEKIQRLSQRPKIPLPPFITCNECGGEVSKSTFKMLDANGLGGVDIVFYGICKECSAPTIAASGDPQAVSVVMHEMMKEINGSKMGVDAFK